MNTDEIVHNMYEVVVIAGIFVLVLFFGKKWRIKENVGDEKDNRSF